MSTDSPVLFYLEEPLYGYSQPVRAGDVVIVDYKWSIDDGKPFVVISALSFGFIRGLCDGELVEFRPSELKPVQH